jgi:hypothetical protein
MRRKLGFISNSSSSSFIIGVGKIIDKKKFEEYCTMNEIDNSDIAVVSTSKIISSEDRNNKWKLYSVRDTNDKDKVLTVDSFNGEEVDLVFDPSKEEEFLIVSMAGNEGDQSFNNGDDDDYDLRYDINEDFFEEKDRKLMEFNKDSGVSDYSCTFGAGRNG